MNSNFFLLLKGSHEVAVSNKVTFIGGMPQKFNK